MTLAVLITLVANDHLLDVGRGVVLNVAHPVLDVLETALGRDVVDEEDAHGAAVVGGGDGPKALLAGRVPNLELDALAVEVDDADLEVDPDRGDERVVEGVLGEAEEEARLADGRVADEQELEQVVVRFRGHGDDVVAKTNKRVRCSRL